MRNLRWHPMHRSSNARAFTLVEAVISTLIVAVMLVAALSAVGASRLIQHRASLSYQGRLLAESLMAEIMQRAYEDPNDTVAFGLETGESAATRAAFDDVDDYDGWSASPPTAADGTVLGDTSGWQRLVTIEWVDPNDPTLTETSETNVKRVTVTVLHEGRQMASFVAVKSGWQLVAQTTTTTAETAAAAAAAATSSLETTSAASSLPTTANEHAVK